MENIIVIKQKDIAYEYSEEFERIWLMITGKGVGEYTKDTVKDENIDLFFDKIKNDWLRYPIHKLRKRTYDKILDLEKRAEWSNAIRLIDLWLKMTGDSDFEKLKHELFLKKAGKK